MRQRLGSREHFRRGNATAYPHCRATDWNNTHRRWSRWAKSGVWDRILAILIVDADNEYAMIDSTIVRAHQHSAGAKKKREKIRRSGKAKAA